ncbi:hypothetical protein PMZ80_009239 [Knufia obscura]|uniref:Ribosomal RNA-processing protein 7 n=2 Tax=Knufia TaxID=430999 RepID=A0AAN8EGF2_9EURO|nr:hypothetical protein PMZ80_009239 [Knufia obscura]KAK5949020.1 hypothetical protein OHC33_009941 [Knufia fluminis]
MSKVPHEVKDYVALPVTIQSKALGKDVKHYIYIKASEPDVPDPDSPRSLFLVNIPVTTTEAQLRHLFATQLSGGHVERVQFAGQHGTASTSSSALIVTTKPAAKEAPTTLGKRKRPTQTTPADIEAKLSSYTLPSTVPSTFHATGSTATAIFLDRTSRDQILRACRKAAKSSKPLIWAAGLAADKIPPLGTSRYEAERRLTFPPRADLLALANDFMSTYSELEAARARESAKRRAEPDEDGFVTVTRGSKGVVKSDEAEAIKAKAKEKQDKAGLQNFYKWQMREKRREEQGALLRQFDEEKRRVREMRERRGGVVPER